MNHRFLTSVGVIATIGASIFLATTQVAGQSQPTAVASRSAATSNWKAARTAWGDPDLTGIYSNSDESGIPFERPAQFEGRRLEDITAKELEDLRVARRGATASNSVAEDRPVDREVFWENLNAVNSRAWLVVDPTDGKIPAMMPEARSRAAARAEARKKSGRGPADAPQDRSLLQPVHLARIARIDDAGDLRKLVRDRAGPDSWRSCTR